MNHVDLTKIRLHSGGHTSIESGACLMEAVAYFAHEPWSDHPKCVSPVLGAFGRSWNDALDDETRQRLVPYIPRFVGTNDGHDDERIWMLRDWLVRTAAPAYLRAAGLTAEADKLAALPPIARAARAAGAGATEAAWAAGAARAAWAAIYDSTYVIAYRQATKAKTPAQARKYADAALAPVVAEVQASAFELLDRLLDVGKTPVSA